MDEQNPMPAVGDVWEAIYGTRRFEIYLVNKDSTVSTRSKLSGTRNIVNIASLLNPKRYRRVSTKSEPALPVAESAAQNPVPRIGDVWGSAGGLRQFRVEQFLNGDVSVQVRSTRLGKTAVIDIAALRDPQKYRLIENYAADPDAPPPAEPDPIAALPRFGPTFVF